MGPILILEDDSVTLQNIGDVLRSQHYRVLEATTSLEALETARRRGSISLLITKKDLPDASGIDVALELITLYPELPALITSSDPKAWWAHGGISNFSRFPPNNLDFMAKPFTASELLMRVRNLTGQTPYFRNGRKHHRDQAA